jgi:DNA replication protein DnaC
MGRCLCHILTEQTRLDRLHTDYASKIKDPQSWNAIDTGVKESKPGGARSFALFIDRMKAWQNRPLQWLYISGDVGTGKSMILKLMAYNIGPWCLYLDASDLSDMIFRATANKELSDLVEVLSTWPILMIDDLGAEHKTDFALNTVRAIINHRYAWPHEYVTVVGSNMSIQELRGDYDRRVGDRLLDQDITEVFNLNVTSYRVRSRLS